MPQQKVDYQKINSLKAKAYDKIALIEAHNRQIQLFQQELSEINNQITEEQNKIEAAKK